MTDVQQQISHLKNQIDSGAEETKTYLGQLKKNIAEYDAEHKYSETASAYLQSGIDSASSAIDELKYISADLQDKAKSGSRDTMDAAQRALCNVRDSLGTLQSKAREFDSKFSGSSTSGVVSGMGTGIENVVNMTRQRTTDAIEMANEQAMRIKDTLQNVADSAIHGAQVGAGEAVKAGEMVDEKLGVTPKVNSTVESVTEMVKNLDQRLHVSETASKIDQTVAFGLGAKVVNKGVELVQESTQYVAETLQQAKSVANNSSTAQQAEGKTSEVGDKASAMAGSVGQSAVETKDQVQLKAQQAQDKAMEMATTAKERVTDATGMGGSGPSMTQQASDKAANVKEGAQDMAQAAQQKGSQMKNTAMQKGSEMKDTAMGKGQQAADLAKEKGGEAADTAKGAKDATMEKGQQAKGKTMEKGQQATDYTKDKASSAKGTGQNLTESSQSSSTHRGTAGGSMKKETDSAQQVADQVAAKLDDVGYRHQDMSKHRY